MFGNAAFATLAMLAAEWPTDHAMFAEIRFVEYPQADEFLDDGLLLVSAR